MRPIDADALYREVKTECNPYGKPTIGFDDGKKVLELIDAAPTIEPEVRHGRWIPVDGEPYAKCSYCGEKHYGCSTPYCDMCGAYMRKEGADNG